MRWLSALPLVLLTSGAFAQVPDLPADQTSVEGDVYALPDAFVPVDLNDLPSLDAIIEAVRKIGVTESRKMVVLVRQMPEDDLIQLRSVKDACLVVQCGRWVTADEVRGFAEDALTALYASRGSAQADRAFYASLLALGVSLILAAIKIFETWRDRPAKLPSPDTSG